MWKDADCLDGDVCTRDTCLPCNSPFVYWRTTDEYQECVAATGGNASVGFCRRTDGTWEGNVGSLEPGICQHCGDGVINFRPSASGYDIERQSSWLAMEECDDGNVISGDGCNERCIRESVISSAASSSSRATCDDNEDNDNDSLIDAASVLACTNLLEATDIQDLVKFRSRREERYPTPWPRLSSIAPIWSAFLSDSSEVQPYVVPLEQVPAGLQEGYMQCTFGPAVETFRDDGQAFRVTLGVGGEPDRYAYVCDPENQTVEAPDVVQQLINESINAYNAASGERQTSRIERWLGALLGRLVAQTGTTGADPYNARVALTRRCYEKGAEAAQRRMGAQRNQRLYTEYLEEFQTECVCNGANAYSAANVQEQFEQMDTQLGQLHDNAQSLIARLRNALNERLNQQHTADERMRLEREFEDQKRAIEREAAEKQQQIAGQISQEMLASIQQALQRAITNVSAQIEKANGQRKNVLGTMRDSYQATLRRFQAITPENILEHTDTILGAFTTIRDQQGGCFSSCVNNWKAANYQNPPASVFQQCRASCVEQQCPFERPPYQPVQTHISAPSSAGTSGGGWSEGDDGGDRGGSSSAGISSMGVSSASSADGGNSSLGGTGGQGGQQGGGGASSRQSFAARSSSAISESACYTIYPVPEEYVPTTRDIPAGGTERPMSRSLTEAIYPLPAGPRDRFIVPTGQISYLPAIGVQGRTRWAWAQVRFAGVFSDPREIDLPSTFTGSPVGSPLYAADQPLLYDGNNTFWGFRTEQCNPSGTSSPRACPFIVNKYTVSTARTDSVTIPNAVLHAKLSDQWTEYRKRALLASDGSLWLAPIGSDVVYQVKPDLSVRSYPFAGVGCRDRSLSEGDDDSCRGAQQLVEGKNGTIWFSLRWNSASGRPGQIGKIIPGGGVELHVVHQHASATALFAGYDNDVWFSHDANAAMGMPYEYHLGHMKANGTVNYVPFPLQKQVRAMVPGRDRMWYVAWQMKVSADGTIDYPGSRTVVGSFSEQFSSARAYNLMVGGLQLDADSVPWAITYGMPWAVPTVGGQQSSSQGSAGRLSVVKFACTSSRSSGVSSTSSFSSSSMRTSGVSSTSSFSSSSMRTSASAVSNLSTFSASMSSSATSVASSVRSGTVSSSVVACPADSCGQQGNTYCASFFMDCRNLTAIPCFTCVAPGSSTRPLSSPPPSLSRSSGLTQSSGVPPLLSSSRASLAAGFFSSASTAFFRSSTALSVVPTLYDGDDIVPLRSSFGSSDPFAFLATSSSFPPPLTHSFASFGLFRSTDVLAARSACGNGILDTVEECDDGNTRDFDGCSQDCLLERGRCGDGIVQTLLDEQCEPSVHDARLSYGCSSLCRFASSLCGNGVVDEGEQCDQGPANSNAQNSYCRPDCGFARCGDGIVDARQSEQCDDGNRIGSDGCSSHCTLERTAPSPLAAQVFTLPKAPGLQQSPSPTGPAVQGYTAQAWQVLPQTTVPMTTASGPGALMVMAGGAAAGVGYMRRKRK